MQYANQHIEFCIEGNGSIFRKLSQPEKEEIAKHHSVIVVSKGENVFMEGEKSRGAIFLSAGKLKLFRIGAGNREQILRIIRPGQVIGFTAFLTEKKWQFTATAMSDSVTCQLDQPAVARVLKKNADLTARLADAIGQELLYSYNRIISLTQKHVRGRLAETLLTVAAVYGFEPDGKTLTAMLSRDDLAHFSNMTTSNAIRTLSELASEGIIQIKGRMIRIPDVTILEEISNTG